MLALYLVKTLLVAQDYIIKIIVKKMRFMTLNYFISTNYHTMFISILKQSVNQIHYETFLIVDSVESEEMYEWTTMLA